MLLIAIFLSSGLLGSPETRPVEPLPRPPALTPSVAFWKNVFGTWDDDQVVYFDSRYLDKIYEIHRLPSADGRRATDRRRETLRETWREALVRDLEALGRPGVNYDALEGRPRRLYEIWDRSREPQIYRDAAQSIRIQRGTRDNFAHGVARSARYLESFRRIFREEGVPEDIVFLPHVESSFRWDARSTRRYMVVDQAVDERLDPHTAARSAARFLKECHDELGAWPLAVTAYNHGLDGMKNAVRETGSDDIGVIIQNYHGPLFGFAGRNFYPELLAVSEVAESILAYPGDLPLQEPMQFVTFELPAYVQLGTVARAFNLSPSHILALNPAIRHPAKRGDLYLTRGFALKLPLREGLDPDALFASIPQAKRPLEKPMLTYRVRPGESLSAIAARHHTSVRALQHLNAISNPHQLRAGMLLKLPH
jgi:peptidoglycan lytic transglycosylase D